jgi:hypothetical protein
MARVNLTDLPVLPLPIAPPANISNLRVLVDDDFRGATVDFNVVAVTNTTAIALLRSLTNSVLAATQLEAVPLATGAYSYDDRAAAIVGQQVWYWIQMQGGGYSTYVGPVTLAVRAGSAAQAVTWVEASSNASTDDSVGVNVVCEVVPGSDASGGVAVYIENYQGNAAKVLIYQDTTQTLFFHLKITNELVTIFVATVNAAGELSALSAGVQLTLNGIATKPCKLTGVSALEGPGLTQISFLAGLEPNITLYKLYRGTYGGPFPGGSPVATLVPTDEPSYSMQDDVGNGHSLLYQWYVTAVNNMGESDPSDAVLPTVAY